MKIRFFKRALKFYLRNNDTKRANYPITKTPENAMVLRLNTLKCSNFSHGCLQFPYDETARRMMKKIIGGLQ